MLMRVHTTTFVSCRSTSPNSPAVGVLGEVLQQLVQRRVVVEPHVSITAAANWPCSASSFHLVGCAPLLPSAMLVSPRRSSSSMICCTRLSGVAGRQRVRAHSRRLKIWSSIVLESGTSSPAARSGPPRSASPPAVRLDDGRVDDRLDLRPAVALGRSESSGRSNFSGFQPRFLRWISKIVLPLVVVRQVDEEQLVEPAAPQQFRRQLARCCSRSRRRTPEPCVPAARSGTAPRAAPRWRRSRPRRRTRRTPCRFLPATAPTARSSPSAAAPRAGSAPSAARAVQQVRQVHAAPAGTPARGRSPSHSGSCRTPAPRPAALPWDTRCPAPRASALNASARCLTTP